MRPRDLTMLAWMLRLEGIEKIAGFVLPKITTGNLGHWLELLLHTDHAIMPTIEGEEVFDLTALQTLRLQLLPLLGGSMRCVSGAMTSSTSLARAGQNVVQLMTDHWARSSAILPPPSAGFQVSAPVFEHFSMGHMLEEEIERDLEHGIMTKTAIHPDQVRPITAAIARAWKKVIEAKAILDVDALAVFGSDGSMCEPATHRTWAAHVIARAQAFGIAEYDNVTAIRPTLPVENRS
jgi:citrate lyase beta subunit